MFRFYHSIVLAGESLYENAGPRRAKPTDKSPRLSSSNLNDISENQPSKLTCIMDQNDFLNFSAPEIRTDQPEEVMY